MKQTGAEEILVKHMWKYLTLYFKTGSYWQKSVERFVIQKKLTKPTIGIIISVSINIHEFELQDYKHEFILLILEDVMSNELETKIEINFSVNRFSIRLSLLNVKLEMLKTVKIVTGRNGTKISNLIFVLWKIEFCNCW